MNAECINRFGSYACRCKPAPGLSSPSHPSSPSAMLNFLYSLCFLLGFFVILLLCVVGTLYRRYHRGAFLVPCSNRGSHEGCDVNDVASVTQNGSQPAPPPPPIRRPRDGWGNPKDRCPSTDLPLLKFSPLVPPEDQTHVEKEEGNQQEPASNPGTCCDASAAWQHLPRAGLCQRSVTGIAVNTCFGGCSRPASLCGCHGLSLLTCYHAPAKSASGSDSQASSGFMGNDIFLDPSFSIWVRASMHPTSSH
ncbi:hypothetical protein JZ751_027596 [Albula glossodonta]|uniref:EGF-like domain-containing protein n=1 Tax=Albula glossodonta TaxID=121402 RepID=A0A8T2NCS1_9TELE|nr:hypothetical protein JZ751_027596 [Albula glossodonta]